jgi:acyl-CoA hydrolase
MRRPETFADIEACIDAVIAAVGREIVLGVPLGIGKPNRFVNALWRRALADPMLKLSIFTALTPALPGGRSLLERRFLGPLRERLYAGYEALDYAEAVRRDAVPPNIQVSEFFFAPGAWLSADYAQRNHVSTNYSQVTQALIDRGVNVVAQSIARRGEGESARYSLGSNPDLTLDLLREPGRHPRPFMVGIVSPPMPFMTNAAETPPDFWDAIVDAGPTQPSESLFVAPNRPVGLADYAIATHVTSLIQDGGTLQIGIGSLGDAVAHLIRLRHTDNAVFRELSARLIEPSQQTLRQALPLELGPFEQGLYGASEMLVEGFLHLIDAGVIRRRVPALADSSRRVLLHAAFFLGSSELYRRLHALTDDERNSIEMTGVRFVNTLDDDFGRKCDDRVKARFINAAMMVTLDGAIVSDSIEGKRVVSGVGGQHDFVSMAERLPGARSLIVLQAARTKAAKTQSNIVFEYGHTTVPRQLRDIVVTEYGAADLRGASDRDVMVRLIGIADARFQDGLREQAQAAGKIERGWRIPDAYRRNTPDVLAERFTAELCARLPHYPLSTDFTPAEARVAVALDYLKTLAGSKRALAALWLEAPRVDAATRPLQERMGFARPRSLEERIGRRLLQGALARTADGRPLCG